MLMPMLLCGDSRVTLTDGSENNDDVGTLDALRRRTILSLVPWHNSATFGGI
jgi:hypothetical protein